ncbi:TIM barrel protein [Corynebacterium callunae]|uniref:hydroxypyruvate isomerase family protein n=1 Tax=Corynebacterium callunae TaxID=1721 RepID=UPI0039827005
MSKFAANLSLLFKEFEFTDRFAKAAEFPFSAVELMYPYDEDINEIKAALDAAGLPLTLFNAPVGDQFGYAANVELPVFKKLMQPALEYAEVLRPEKMHILSGLVEHTAEASQRYIANISWAATKLERLNVLAVIEPINGYSIPGYFLNDLDQALKLVAAIDHPNVKILFDIFHLQQIHGDLIHQLEKVTTAGLLGHVQVAGVPARNEPGTGEVNEALIFKALDVAGYQGYVGAEYNPKADTISGLGWLDNHVSTP